MFEGGSGRRWDIRPPSGVADHARSDAKNRKRPVTTTGRLQYSHAETLCVPTVALTTGATGRR